MILVLRQRSQISNRLVALAALTSFCIRHDIRVLVLSLSDYREMFEAGDRTHRITLLFLPLSLYRLLCRIVSNRFSRRILQCCPGIHYLNETRSWADLPPSTLQRGLWIIDQAGDWCSSMPAISHAEAPVIRKIFRYRERYHQQAYSVYADARAKSSILIGIHARRGDYSRHRGGVWHYNEGDYLDWIEQAKHEFRRADEGQIHFLLCSNEPGFLQAQASDSLTVSPLSDGPTDQLLLSLCDVIIDPPSTFSVWAAFLTESRILHLFSRDQRLYRSQLRESTLFYGWSPRLERAAQKA